MTNRVAIITGTNLSATLAALLAGRGGQTLQLMNPMVSAKTSAQEFEEAVLREATKLYAEEGVMVPRAGIEPALLSEPHFECGASTSSANGARHNQSVAEGVYHGIAHPRKLHAHPKENAFEFPEELIDAVAMGAIEDAYGFFTPFHAEGTVPHYTQYDVSSDLSQEQIIRAAMMMNMEQREFADRLVKLKDNLTLPGSLDVDFKFDQRGYFYAQIVDLEGTDNVTGEDMQWKGRKWLLSLHKKDSEIIQTVFKALLTAVEHEVREQFLYKDVPVLDPHLDVEKLIELRKQADSTSKRG